MAFPLSFLTGQNTVNSLGTMGNGDNTISEGAVKQLSAQNGQVISGQIVKIEDGNVIMKVGDDLVSARVGTDMDINVGQNMTFQVQNQNGMVALRALFTNTDINPTTTKALDAAGLPVTNTTVNLTNAMMKEGMNISPQSLQTMYRAVVDNPQASADLLVKMTRLQIPITSENITQFQNYESFNHELSKGIADLSENYMALTKELAGSDVMESGGLFDVSKQVIDTFAEGDLTFFQKPLSEEETKLAQALSVAGDEIEELAGANKGDVSETQNQAQMADVGGDFLKQLAAAGAQKESSMELADGELSKADGVPKEDVASAREYLTQNLTQENKELAMHLKEMGVSSNEIPRLLSASPEQTLSFVSKLLAEAEQLSPNEKNALTKFLTSPSMERLLNAQMKDAFALKPEDVADKDKVSKLYDSIVEKTAKLSQSMAELGKADTAFAGNVTNMSQNVQFMHDINQVMQYIQIPFQMQGKNANGELYVFTNKKSVASEDGSVSAFLHLDMDHLGPTSVYVNLKDSKVATRFYVSDDSILDFISENIHLLDERLAKRGYSMQATMKVQKEDEPFDVVEGMQKVNAETGVANRMISAHGFDMRA